MPKAKAQPAPQPVRVHPREKHWLEDERKRRARPYGEKAEPCLVLDYREPPKIV